MAHLAGLRNNQMIKKHNLLYRIKVLLLKRKYYRLHYKMWDYIVDKLTVASEEELGNIDFIDELKFKYTAGEYLNHCYLCHMCFYFKEGCESCPLYKSTGMKCAWFRSPYFIVTDTDKPKTLRIKAAKKIRDCVLIFRRK